jgi:hypothetical protein
MTTVVLELLTRPPAPPSSQSVLGADAIEFVADTDNLLAMCSCSASDSQPY